MSYIFEAPRLPPVRLKIILNYFHLLGAYIVDAIDFLDKALASDAAIADVDGGESASATYSAPQKIKLVITSDCFDLTFINLMLRYTSAALLIQPISGDEAISARGDGGLSMNFSHANAQNDHRRKGVKITVRSKLSTSRIEDKMLFSSVVFSSGQLVCTTPVDHLQNS